MATPISHVVYAINYLDKHASAEIERDLFVLGSVFPDVRFACPDIKRKETHNGFVKVDLSFDGLTSFEAGWKFHIYCDMRREEILNNYDFYGLKGADALGNRASKLLEDKLVYATYNNWEKYARLFLDLPELNLPPNFDLTCVKRWYQILGNYLKEAPTKASTEIYLQKLPKFKPDAPAILTALEKLSKNQRAIEILRLVEKEIV